jgi:hypothetical protein
MSFSLVFPNLEVEELATAIMLVRSNCKQTDDNVTSGKSCFPFEARNGLLPGKQLVVSRLG